jgi:hypothetical protein
MTNGLQPYDPSQRADSGQSDETRSSDRHFHYYDHRTFVHADGPGDEPEEKGREPILLPWQKNAFGLIIAITAAAMVTHFAPTPTTVTTRTVETNVVDTELTSNQPVAPQSVSGIHPQTDGRGPVAAGTPRASLDMAKYLAPEGGYFAGESVMLDELGDDAPPVCDGKYIWTFDGDGLGTFSLAPSGDDYKTMGHYHFDGKTLVLTDMIKIKVEDWINRRPTGQPQPDISYSVRKLGDRLQVGKIRYRVCAANP